MYAIRSYYGLAHGQADSSLLQINIQDPDGHIISYRDDIHWVLHKAITKLGNMHETIILDSDIDKGTKVDHVAYGTLQFHTWRQVLDLKHIGAENR